MAARGASAVLAVLGLACAEASTSPTGRRTLVDVVAVTPRTSQLGLGGTLQLKVTAFDSEGNELSGRATFWASSDTNVAKVSDAGLVTSRRLGVAQIQVAVEGKPDYSAITVVAQPVARVTVTPAAPSVAAGSVVQLQAATTDAAGNALADRLVFWQSSNDAVARVTSTGLVSGIAVGTATITATSEQKSATAVVTVTGAASPAPQPTPPAGGNSPATVDSVKVAPADTTMVRNTSTRFRATVYAGGRAVTGRTVTWSTSTPDVLVVDGTTGDVTALNRPNTDGYVNATVEGKVGSARVKVLNKPANSISVSAATRALAPGDQLEVSATVRDVDSNPVDDGSVVWASTNPAVLKVVPLSDNRARLEAQTAGPAAVIAASEAVSDRVDFSVVAPAPPPTPTPPAPTPPPQPSVAMVTVAPASWTLVRGQTQQLTATARDGSGNELTGRMFEWSSSNNSVATVSTTGFVTSVSAGSATISAKTGDVTGTAAITVTVPQAPMPAPVVARVETSPAKLDMKEGDKRRLTATAYDASGAVIAGRTCTWTSNSTAHATVASVNASTADVTALKATRKGPPIPGDTLLITATCDGKSGSTSAVIDDK